ncbi:hypothetical protein CDCA_CDCA07G2061 [Cyanidium caldarium]|uniref:holo-[acyl-carrier-protein] synthase n=1 Tax=Cyanidium caldarium TaxID=2771 RepID=A0AAV9IVA9_CYACA|nr:hypothetical protein CDCA_CDCA07G2061 [Cyanidium caldarium]
MRGSTLTLRATPLPSADSTRSVTRRLLWAPPPLGKWLNVTDAASSHPALESSFSSLQPGTVHVWRLPIDRLPVHESWLAPAERERGHSMQAARRREYLACRTALRWILSRWYAAYITVAGVVAPDQLRIETGARGKPYLVAALDPMTAPPLQWSLSHTRDWALLAIAPALHHVGCDLECLDRRLRHRTAVVQRYFTAGEQARLCSDADLLRLWSRKEAVAKATGVGLSQALRTVDCGDPTALTHHTTDVAGTPWYLLSMDDVAAQLYGTVALTGDAPVCTLQRFEWGGEMPATTSSRTAAV